MTKLTGNGILYMLSSETRFEKFKQRGALVLSNISETRSWIQNLRPDLKSLNKKVPYRAVLCKQTQNCLLLLSNIRSWIQNQRPDLKS